MKLRSTIVRGLAPVALLAFLAGCAAVPGEPVAGEIDIRTLDIGSYPTDPLDYRTKFSPGVDDGVQLSIMRLAGAVPNGLEIDPSLKYGRQVKPLRYDHDAGFLLFDGATEIVERHKMMFGFSMSAATTAAAESKDYSLQRDVNKYDDGKQTGTTSVNLTVLQFADADTARTVATELEAADFAAAADLNQAVTLEEYPDAKAHWRPGIPTLGATMAHGSYVVNVFVKRPDPDLAALKQLTGKALAAQLPLLDQLPPLSKRDMLHLDYDPQAMLRRTLHPDDYMMPDFLTEAQLTPRAFLHTTGDQETWKQRLELGGIDALSTVDGGALLLRTRDSGTAAVVLDDFKNRAQTILDAPAGVPGAYCQEYPTVAGGDNDARYFCTVRYDRYVARVASAQLKDAQQLAAAQYALLANSSWM
ncbi:hypothetical protein [Nocardia sp. NPDC127526]|uniref:DUF7373 family lipoprotein n=1 Tax=Nocardia sp. NPDC127526 TaxID=3345393 RepID=UPI003630D889